MNKGLEKRVEVSKSHFLLLTNISSYYAIKRNNPFYSLEGMLEWIRGLKKELKFLNHIFYFSLKSIFWQWSIMYLQ